MELFANKSYLKALDLLHTSCMLASLVMAHKIAIVYGVSFSIASLIFPLTYVITNIIATVYGYHNACEVMWRGIMAQVPFTIICTIALFIPTPYAWQHDSAYAYVFQDLFRMSIGSIVGAYCGFKFNIYVLSHCEKILKINSFYLRNFSACVFGEIAFTWVALPIMFYGTMPFATLMNIIITSMCIKIIYSFVLSVPGQAIANKLSKLEDDSPIDKARVRFDPFEV